MDIIAYCCVGIVGVSLAALGIWYMMPSKDESDKDEKEK